MTCCIKLSNDVQLPNSKELPSMKTLTITIAVCICMTIASDISSKDAEKAWFHAKKHPEVKVKTRIIEKKIPVPYTVEKRVPYTVYKKVPYKVRVPFPQPYVVEKKVPYPVKEYVKVPYYVPKPYEVIKKIPYEVKVPVPRPVEVKIPVPKPYIVEKKVPKPFKVYVPQPYTVEKRVPYPVKVMVPVPHPYTVEKKVPYEVKVPVDRPYIVHVPKPYPVHFEEHVPVPVERPVPYPVTIPVDKPFPVEIPKPVPIPVKFPTEENSHFDENNYDVPVAAALTQSAPEGWNPHYHHYRGHQIYENSPQEDDHKFTLSTKLNVGHQATRDFQPSKPDVQSNIGEYNQQMYEHLPQYYDLHSRHHYAQLGGYRHYPEYEQINYSGHEQFVHPAQAEAFTQADAKQNLANQNNGQSGDNIESVQENSEDPQRFPHQTGSQPSNGNPQGAQGQAQQKPQNVNSQPNNFPQGAQNFELPQNYATQDQPQQEYQSEYEPFQQSLQQMHAGLVQSTLQEDAPQPKSNYSFHNHPGLGQFSDENGDSPNFAALVQQNNIESNQQKQAALSQEQAQQHQGSLNLQSGAQQTGPQSQYEDSEDMDYEQYIYDDGSGAQISQEYYQTQGQGYAQPETHKDQSKTRHMNPKGQVYNAHGGGGDKTHVIKYTNLVVHPKPQKAQKKHELGVKPMNEVSRKQDVINYSSQHHAARNARNNMLGQYGVEYSDGVLIQSNNYYPRDQRAHHVSRMEGKYRSPGYRAPKALYRDDTSYLSNGWTPLDLSDFY